MKFNFTLYLLFLSTITIFGQVTPINNSYIAFTVDEKDLLPENIAYNPQNETFYIGSTRKGKIIKMTKDGKPEVFVKPNTFGQWMIIGMKVDVVRQILWVCSSGGDNLVGYNKKDDVDGRPAGIFKIDLKTGKLIKKYLLDDEKGIHFFNDLVVNKVGDVFITHMFQDHSLYTIPHDGDVLQEFHSLETLEYPNGLTLSSDEKHLFIAHSKGISSLNVATKKLTPVSTPEGMNISHKESIDGLYYFDNSLIGIQSDTKTVQRFYLDESEKAIFKSEFLELAHPMMDHPTTGVIVGNELYYIANAQFERFNKDGSLYDYDQLYEVIVLKTQLK